MQPAEFLARWRRYIPAPMWYQFGEDLNAVAIKHGTEVAKAIFGARNPEPPLFKIIPTEARDENRTGTR